MHCVKEGREGTTSEGQNEARNELGFGLQGEGGYKEGKTGGLMIVIDFGDDQATRDRD